MSAFKINLEEKFRHLARAPIVEAVIHWRARSEEKLKPNQLRQQLVAELPDYPTVKTQHELHIESALRPRGAAVSRRDEWHGFRLESSDGRYVAQFTRNGFIFSRLRPYEDWDRFAAEAKRLWRVHVAFAKPSEIARLGVRFINRVVPAEPIKLSDILAVPPQCPAGLGLPISDFLHRSLFDVPGYPYQVHVIQATQPSAPPERDVPALILDIDVFTATVSLDDTVVDARLAEMRWLKNKAFNTFLTQKAIAHFEEDTPWPLH